MTSRAVATPHDESARAAQLILDAGGNAVDAVIAAIAAQGVVAPETCGVGGDLFALIHHPGWERPRAINASGRAGSGADAALVDGRSGTVPRDHPLAVTIPGCVDGLVAMAEEFGRVSLATSLGPAIELAREGFAASDELTRAFTLKRSVYHANPAVADLYPAGQPVGLGEPVRRPHLAETLEGVADGGREAFYLGSPGEDIIEAVDGIITRDDLERDHSDWVEPIGIEVAGLTAWTIPPNSQGYLGPGALAVFEMQQPPEDSESPLWWHLLIESYRCLAWERNDIVADPDHLPLPLDLYLDRDRLERAAASVTIDRAGIWPDRIGAVSGTAYLCVADQEGLSVSLIQSNYHGTGSPLGASRSGFLLHDRGAGFSLTKGHPNQVAPGKRPLHTLSPTLWTGGSLPRWLLGTRGGAVQPQLVAQVAARAILGNESLDDAMAAPRWTMSEFGPGSGPRLAIEPGVPDTVLAGLHDRGHQVEVLTEQQPGWGPASIIEVDGDERRAAADPRVNTSRSLVW